MLYLICYLPFGFLCGLLAAALVAAQNRDPWTEDASALGAYTFIGYFAIIPLCVVIKDYREYRNANR